MRKGVYCLLLFLDSEQTIKVGALGEIPFEKGWYIYVGSALGSGGLLRVKRHIRFFFERYRKPKWHIDYLLERALLKATVCAQTNERLECVLAKNIGKECVLNFGCSDCSCESHLFYREDNPEWEVVEAFAKTNLKCCVHRTEKQT